MREITVCVSGRVLIRDFFQKLVPETGTVLDLGCGWGEFVNRPGRTPVRYGLAAGARLDKQVTFLLD